MKTAEEYWDEFQSDSGKREGCNYIEYRHLGNGRRDAIGRLIAAIAADARADALAEAKAVTDPDEERAKREWEHFLEHWRKNATTSADPSESSTLYRAFRTYAKTLPPRPMRSPGQRLFESERDECHHPHTQTWLSTPADEREHFETRAIALGIQPKE